MARHRIEQAVVLFVGFLLGASLAALILPGGFLSWLVAGLVVSILCREYFLSSWLGELLWWTGKRDRRPKTAVGRGEGR